MSKTDKTRPWSVRTHEYEAADPYRARREGFSWTHAELIGGCSCWQCRGWIREDRRKRRREGKRACRDWDIE